MPIKWLCTKCKNPIIELNGEWLHQVSQKYVCNPKADPEDQTVATKRIT